MSIVTELYAMGWADPVHRTQQLKAIHMRRSEGGWGGGETGRLLLPGPFTQICSKSNKLGLKGSCLKVEI